MAIKIFFSVLVLCTAAVVAVALALHFRVKRHLRQAVPPNPALGPLGTEASAPGTQPALGLVPGGRDAKPQAQSADEDAGEPLAGEDRRARFS